VGGWGTAQREREREREKERKGEKKKRRKKTSFSFGIAGSSFKLLQKHHALVQEKGCQALASLQNQAMANGYLAM
jgi:hypothetical protein